MQVLTTTVREVQGILKAQSKAFSRLKKLGITFPVLSFSFILKATEKIWGLSYKYTRVQILFSSSGRISYSIFCDSIDLTLTSIITLYKFSFITLSLLLTVSPLKAENSCYTFWPQFLSSRWIRKRKGKRKEKIDEKEGGHCS